MHAVSNPGEITNIWGFTGALFTFLSPLVVAGAAYLGRQRKEEAPRGNEDDRKRLEDAVGVSTDSMNDGSVRLSRVLLDNIEQLQLDNADTRTRLDKVQAQLIEREKDWDGARVHATLVHDWIDEKVPNLGAPSRPSWANFHPTIKGDTP